MTSFLILFKCSSGLRLIRGGFDAGIRVELQ